MSRSQLILLVVGCMVILSGCGTGGISSTDMLVPADTRITLERTMCFGTCPVYTIAIEADGSVTYTGKMYVQREGTFQSSIPQEKLLDLVKEFERINYFTFQDAYTIGDLCPINATDHPGAIMSFHINGKSKSIDHDYGCQGFTGEAELTKLEKMIDTVVNTSQWIE